MGRFLYDSPTESDTRDYVGDYLSVLLLVVAS